MGSMNISYIIIYTFAVLITSIIYILLYSSKRQEFLTSAEKIQKIPTLAIRLGKIIPTLIVLFFVIFSVPQFDIFFIMIIITFIFCLLGDLGIIFNVFLGLVLFFTAHSLFFASYLTQILKFDVSQLLSNGTFIALGIFIVVSLIVAVLIIRYMNNKINENHSKPWKIKLALFSYLSILFLHSISSFIIAYNYFKIKPGIIVIFIGSILFFVSDFLISVREFHHKQKYSVLYIMSTYYSALLLISFITYFYQTI